MDESTITAPMNSLLHRSRSCECELRVVRAGADVAAHLVYALLLVTPAVSGGERGKSEEISWFRSSEPIVRHYTICETTSMALLLLRGQL